MLRVVRNCLAWLAIVVIPLLVLGILWDTVVAFVSPEKYKFVQYKHDWANEGFWGYIIGNISLAIGGVIFWISSIKMFKHPIIFWKIIFYGAWLLILIRALYILIR